MFAKIRKRKTKENRKAQALWSIMLEFLYEMPDFYVWRRMKVDVTYRMERK